MGKHYHQVETIDFDSVISDKTDQETISQLLSASTVFWNFMTENLKEKALSYVNSKDDADEQTFRSDAVGLLGEVIRKLSDQEITNQADWKDWKGLTYEAYKCLFWFIRFGEPLFMRYADLLNAYQQARENSNSDIKLLKANVPGPKTERSNLCVSFVANQVELLAQKDSTVIYVRPHPSDAKFVVKETPVFRFVVEATRISKEHLTGITIKREMSPPPELTPIYSVVFHYFNE